MPLVRHEISSFLRCTHGLAQYSTQASANYANFKKLRAFPFKVTPDEAKKSMASTAGLLCNDFSFPSTFLAAVFPFFNGLQPVRFSAAYFPAWIVNAEIEVDITYKDGRRKGTFIFNNSYLPGSHIPTLSAAPLLTNGLDFEEPLPSIIQQPQQEDHIKQEKPQSELHSFDPSLLMQHGEEVQCIPFTVSPFSLLDVARNLPWTDAVINEDLKFAPSSLKVNLFSAYPVLLPLYIAMYEMKRSDVAHGSTLTMWSQAHCNWSTMTDNFADKFQDKTIARLYTQLGILTPTSSGSEVFSYLPPDDQVKIAFSSSSSKRAAKSIERWLQNALGSSSNISKLAGTIDNDDDPRIRPMTLNEEAAIRKYIENETEILSIKGDIEKFKRAKPIARLGPDGQQEHYLVAKTLAIFEAELDLRLARKKELELGWWTEWESKQSQETPS